MAGLARSRRSEHAWSVEHKHRQRVEAALAERANDAVTQADIDESLEETFPASDPPSWGALVRIGSPRRAHDA
jgi:hypothetical protein